MSTRFKSKVIMITGAGSGLGQAVALQLASEGADLALIDLSRSSLEDTESLIAEKYSETQCHLIEANVANEGAVKAYVDSTLKAFGRIDGL